MAVERSNTEMIELLLSLGASPHLTDDGESLSPPSTPLEDAMYADNFEAFVVMRRHAGATPEQDANLMMTAAALGNMRYVRWLVEEMGSDVNVRGSVFPGIESYPLHKAARNREVEAARYLLDKGADPNARSVPDSSTPLHMACEGCSEAVIGMLVEAGADVHARDANGRLPADRWVEYVGGPMDQETRRLLGVRDGG